MEVKAPSPKAYKLFHEGVLTLSEIEANGIKIDNAKLIRNIKKADRQKEQAEQAIGSDPLFKKWKEAYGRKTNVGSNAQLAFVLQSEGYDWKGETSTGRKKTDEETLEKLNVPIVNHFLRMKKMEKVSSTFLKGIQRETVDGFLHSVFNLHLARSYRSSSSNPNYQNYPVRDEELSKMVRSAFIAREGHQILEIDFKAVEVSIAACYNRDPVLIDYIKDPQKDMHRDMAAECFKCKPEDVAKKMRYSGKNQFVFPQFYGSYFVDCARNIWETVNALGLEVEGISKLGKCDPRQKPVKGTFEHHIMEVEKGFWNKRFKRYRDWKKEWHEAYVKKGWFELKTGFVVHGPLSRNQVINTPIQGSAFHCLLQYLIWMQRFFKKNKLRSRIIGQIHDSVVIDAHRDEIDLILEVARNLLVRLQKEWEWIIVPLTIEAELAPLGGSWYDKEEIEI